MNEEEEVRMMYAVLKHHFEQAELIAQLDRRLSKHMLKLNVLVVIVFVMLIAGQIAFRQWPAVLINVMWLLIVGMQLRISWRDAHRLTPQERLDAMHAEQLAAPPHQDT